MIVEGGYNNVLTVRKSTLLIHVQLTFCVVLCGQWEQYPWQFAKCWRCRKAKYCGKDFQSSGMDQRSKDFGAVAVLGCLPAVELVVP